MIVAKHTHARWLRVTIPAEDQTPEILSALVDLREVPGPRIQETGDAEDPTLHVDAPHTVLGCEVWERLAAAVLAANGPNISELLGQWPATPSEAVAFKRPLFPHQSAAVDWLLERGRGLLADEMGLGKGLREDEPVLTPSRGWVRIADLRVGDVVSSVTGGHARVRGVYPRGEVPLYRVSFSDGTSVVTDADHRWHVQSAVQRWRGTHVVVTTAELLASGLHRVSARGDRKSAWFLPPISPPEMYPVGRTSLPLPAYVLGVLLGDGSLGADGSVCVSNPSAAVYARIQEELAAAGLDPARVTQLGRRCQTYSLGPDVRERVAALGLRGTRSETKFVPEAYSCDRLAVEERRALLAGLLDTDGTVSRDGRVVTFSSASPALADSVANLVRSLGGVASRYRKDITKYTYKGEERRGLPSHVVNIRTPCNPFGVREQRVARWRPQVLARAFANIEPIGTGKSVCIEVDASDSLFITRDYIPTHNTTSAAVAAASMRGTGVVLIIGPSFTRPVWRGELRALGSLGGEDDFFAFQGNEIREDTWARAGRARFWFIHYELVSVWMPRLLVNPVGRPSVVVIDEAHWLRNSRSQRTGRVLKSIATISKRILLTGTPVANRPRELWSLLTILDGTHSWGSEYAFRLRYCGGYDAGYGLQDSEPTNTEELRARLRNSYLRRTQEDAGIDLPDLLRSVYDVDGLPNFAHMAASRAELEAVTRALQRGTFGTDTLVVMTRLSQETSVVKVPATTALLQELVDVEEPVVVFVHERARAEELARKAGRSAVAIHGGLSQATREELVRDFQAGKHLVVVATYGALREGVTLHRARHVILHDLTWVPGDVLQAEKRVHRIGQQRTVTSRWMVLPGSFDTLLAAHLCRKGSAILESVGDARAEEAFSGSGLARFTRMSVDDEIQRFLSQVGAP